VKKGVCFLQVLSINSLSNLGIQEVVFFGVKMMFFGVFLDELWKMGCCFWVFFEVFFG